VQLKTNRKVAIKVYEKAKVRDLQRRKGVRREIKLLQKLNHQNIVKILDTIESNNHINIILEYVGGCSLHSFLKKQQVNHNQ
jgi:MAP/microtubule affinity-regulating kinase